MRPEQTPLIVGRVFTRGIGGEVFSYRPPDGGCLACLEAVLERTRFRDGVREIDLVSEKEREQLYGLNPKEIKDSPGLAVDIGFITSFHVRFVLEALATLAPQRPKFLVPLDENYLVWGNGLSIRSKKPSKYKESLCSRKDGCLICGGGNEA